MVFCSLWLEDDWLMRLAGEVPTWVWKKWQLFSRIKTGLEYLRQQYIWSLLGIVFTWVLFDGIRHQLLIKD